jgi:hypothetical protein
VKRRRRCAGAVVIASCVVLGAAPAAQSRSRLPPFYDIVRASGSETVTFEGDGSAGCQSTGHCADAGTITYTFGDTTGFFFLEVDSGAGVLLTKGTTHAELMRSGTPCTDDVVQTTEQILVLGGKVLFHPGGKYAGIGPDHLANRCGGPLDADLVAGQALLTGRLQPHPERRRTLHIAMSADRPFTAAGFTGTVDASVTMDLRRSR